MINIFSPARSFVLLRGVLGAVCCCCYVFSLIYLEKAPEMKCDVCNEKLFYAHKILN